jgi:transposase
VVTHVKQRRTSVNFLRFLKDVVGAFPDRDLHMVLDNLNIHKNQAAQRWLKLHPRVHFHYTPTHASWVNRVECFFSILGKQGLSQSVHTSKRQLKEFLLNYMARNNQPPPAFRMDQRAGKTSAHYRGDQAIPSNTPAQAEEAPSAPPDSQYYKELTGRCTRFRRFAAPACLQSGDASRSPRKSLTYTLARQRPQSNSAPGWDLSSDSRSRQPESRFLPVNFPNCLLSASAGRCAPAARERPSRCGDQAHHESPQLPAVSQY